MKKKNYINRIGKLALFIFLAGCLLFIKTTTAQPVISLSPVINTGLSAPIQLVNAGDGSNRIFIVQQGGSIRAYDSLFNFISTFLTVSNVTYNGERGLLSMVFHPDYKSNGLFYVYYVNLDGNLELARYHVSGTDSNIADPASKVIVITIPHPTNTNHNGGELHFGNDGYLYLSTGDGGGAGDQPNNAQNTSVLLGKILRFNVNTSATAPFYSIPAGNPYNNEIFYLGLRNPFRWSFDRLTHDVWIGDVGQDTHEEIDYLPAGTAGGANFGWHCYEANNAFNTTGCAAAANYVFPVYNYPTQNPSAAVTGGIVYRGNAYPTLQGYNISADFYSGIFYLTTAAGSNWVTNTQTITPTGMVDFGETENGEAYGVSLISNKVYRITASGALALTLTGFNGEKVSKGVKLNWQTMSEQNIKQFEIEYSKDDNIFNPAGVVKAQNTATSSGYTFEHVLRYRGTIFYRLKIVNADNSYKYSGTIRLFLTDAGKDLVVPSVISNGIMNVDLADQSYTSLELVSANGTVLLRRDIAGQTGNIKVPVDKLATGIYIIRLIGNTQNTFQKVLIQQ